MIIDAHIHIRQRVHGRIGGRTPVTPVRDRVIRIGDQPVLGMPPYMHDCAALAEHVLCTP